MKARKIDDSWIAHAAPCVRETWDYLLRHAAHKEHKYDGYTIQRGELFRSYREIREALYWKVGYRKEMYSEGQMKRAMNDLMNNGMIELTNEPRGNLIKVLNYCIYQDPKNYEQTDERTKNEPRTDQERTNSGGSINKNKRIKELKNEKKGKAKKISPTLPSLKTQVVEVLHSFKEKGYTPEFLRTEGTKFLSYWTETNTKGKQRYEGEKYFDVKKRLTTWFSKAEAFKGSSYTQETSKPKKVNWDEELFTPDFTSDISLYEQQKEWRKKKLAKKQAQNNSISLPDAL